MKVAFYKGTSRIADRLIQWKTGGPYSHCEAVFSDVGYPSGFFYCASSSFLDKGVRFKAIDLANGNWDVMDVPGIDEQAVRQWFFDHKGQPYDVRGIVNFLIPVGHNKHGWFCDEALGAAADVPHPHRFDPTDLACIFERMGGIWRGRDIALHKGDYAPA